MSSRIVEAKVNQEGFWGKPSTLQKADPKNIGGNLLLNPTRIGIVVAIYRAGGLLRGLGEFKVDSLVASSWYWANVYMEYGMVYHPGNGASWVGTSAFDWKIRLCPRGYISRWIAKTRESHMGIIDSKTANSGCVQ